MQKLISGLYEPEGLYLSSPVEGEAIIREGWGAHPEYHASVTYQGVPLKGHPGIDFELTPQTKLLAVDDGRVCEIAFDRSGLMQYLKLEHRWGESLYAYLGEIVIDSGQLVSRGTHVAYAMDTFFHFGIRVIPYNRFDGWGGFTDPTPYLNPNQILFIDQANATIELSSKSFTPLHPMAQERINQRRP